MKYVILKLQQPELGVIRALSFIFPDYVTHSTVALGMIFAYIKEEQQNPELYSAGFCSLDPVGDWECTRGSESLKVKKNAMLDGIDAQILNMQNALQGIINI